MIKRTIEKYIIESIKTKPVTIITGARQVGKTTLVTEIGKEFGFNYVSLDVRAERAAANTDPELFLSLHPHPLIIDEIQKAPALFESIEAIVNEKKRKGEDNKGMYILTGSQSYKLMSGAKESLSGRATILTMSPLSASEVFGKEEKPFTFLDLIKTQNRIKEYSIDVNQLYELMIKGLYPELYDNPLLKPAKFYDDYLQTYIERDVRGVIELKDDLKFERFVRVLASLSGQELNYETISKAIEVSIPTVQSWISILVKGHIAYLLEPYNEISLIKRVVKRPKIYFEDVGMAANLMGIHDVDTLKNSVFLGRFVETYIVGEIRKSYLNNLESPSFFYYRDNNQNEIDLLILENGRLMKIECKSGMTYSLKDVKSFNQLNQSAYVNDRGCIICNTKEIYSLSKDVVVLPITSI